MGTPGIGGMPGARGGAGMEGIVGTGGSGAVDPFAWIGSVVPLGATGPESSDCDRNVIRTVSFLKGTVEVFLSARSSLIC